METTTIRVDRKTHRLLSSLSDAQGSTLQITVRDAAEALRRWRFAEQVRGEVAALEATDELDDYLADIELTTVPDGVD